MGCLRGKGDGKRRLTCNLLADNTENVCVSDEIDNELEEGINMRQKRCLNLR